MHDGVSDRGGKAAARRRALFRIRYVHRMRDLFDPVRRHDAASLWSRIFPSHAAGKRERVERGIWSRIIGINRAAKQQAAKPVSEAEAKQQSAQAHIPITFPIKCDLCDGLPFMGC